MKKIVVVLILCASALFSCSNNNDGKYIGTWYTQYGDTFEVKKENEGFLVNIHQAGIYGKYTYKLEDGSLIGESI